jgi:hypothetical protein
MENSFSVLLCKALAGFFSTINHRFALLKVFSEWYFLLGASILTEHTDYTMMAGLKWRIRLYLANAAIKTIMVIILNCLLQ